MKILLVHNFYRSSSPSGENSVYTAEKKLLEEHGHEILSYEKQNDDLVGIGPWKLFWRGGVSNVWSSISKGELVGVLSKARPDVVHFHNTFPQVSQSAYYACWKCGVPAVQTLHNFRIFCVNGQMFRNGRVCEDCLKYGSWMGFVHGCYRNSRLFSSALILSHYVHKMLWTYKKRVNRFVALTEFTRGKMIEGGLPPERVVVKPNFVDVQELVARKKDYLVFVGRLDEAKGVGVLLDAARRASEIELKVVGGGPLLEEVKSQAPGNMNVLGLQPMEKTMGYIAEARALLMPSIWYECFPRTIVEAFAIGTPVIASGFGSMAEIVKHEKTGLHFPVGDAESLARTMRRIMQDKNLSSKLGRQARMEYEGKYTPENNYRQLMNIYEQAIEERKRVR